MKKRVVILIIFFSLITILLSSCSIVSEYFKKTQAAKDIKTTVSTYFDQLKDGSLTKLDYKSDYAKDTLFTGLKISDVDAAAIMGEALGVISYQIMDSKCETVDKTGSCQVNVIFVDVKDVLADLDEGYSAAAVRLALFAKDAPTSSELITLQMSFNEDTQKWMITDTTQIVKYIGEPYKEIVFRSDPADTIDSLITALREGDEDTINTLSPNCPSRSFFADVMIFDELQAYYEMFDLVIDGDPEVDGDTATVNVSISRPDIAAIWNHLSEDKAYMTELTKEYVLKWMQDEGDPFFYEEDMLDKMWPEGEAYFSDPSFRKELTITFDLIYDEETNDWTFVSIPPEFYSIKLDYQNIRDASDSTAAAAMDILLELGSLDQTTYDYILDFYNQPEVVPDVSGDELIEDLNRDSYWCGYNDDGSLEEVTEYSVGDTYSLLCFLNFNSDWSGIYLTTDWYGEDGTVPLSSNIVKIIGGDSWAYADCTYPDIKNISETISAGIYRLVISAPDGTVIAENSIEVK